MSLYSKFGDSMTYGAKDIAEKLMPQNFHFRFPVQWRPLPQFGLYPKKSPSFLRLMAQTAWL